MQPHAVLLPSRLVVVTCAPHTTVQPAMPCWDGIRHNAPLRTYAPSPLPPSPASLHPRTDPQVGSLSQFLRTVNPTAAAALLARRAVLDAKKAGAFRSVASALDRSVLVCVGRRGSVLVGAGCCWLVLHADLRSSTAAVIYIFAARLRPPHPPAACLPAYLSASSCARPPARRRGPQGAPQERGGPPGGGGAPGAHRHALRARGGQQWVAAVRARGLAAWCALAALRTRAAGPAVTPSSPCMHTCRKRVRHAWRPAQAVLPVCLARLPGQPCSSRRGPGGPPVPSGGQAGLAWPCCCWVLPCCLPSRPRVGRCRPSPPPPPPLCRCWCRAGCLALVCARCGSGHPS